MIEILLLSGALLAPVAPSAIPEDLRLPALIDDGMVLQRDREVALWGWDRPGQELQIRGDWMESEVRTRAGDDGRWRVAVRTPGAGGPHSIEIRGSSRRTVSDVLIGEVWICSGQSNMEWPLGRSQPGYDDLEDHEPDGKIRLFKVGRSRSARPLEDCQGEWTPCSKERSAGFSGVAYFFARDLVRELDVPIGLIGTHWGGTRAEAWTSRPTLERFPEFGEPLQVVDRFRTDPEGVAAERRERERSWWKEIETLGGEAASAWTRPAFDDGSWGRLPVPGRWESEDLAAFDGSVWFRTAAELPSAWEGEELRLSLGPIDDCDQVWFNGELVGRQGDPDSWRAPREYIVPGRLVRAGKNQITVQVIDTGGDGGLYGRPEQLALRPTFEKPSLPVPLAGDWRYRKSASAGSIPPRRFGPTLRPNSVTVLYNGMIAPLLPYGIRGAIWYQGESNRGRPSLYARLFPALIRDWRAGFGQGDFPFYFVQIAPFDYAGDTGQAALLREAQAGALSLANTGMVVTVDVGNPQDIHPRDKRTVGHRLALWALYGAYGKVDSAPTGPHYQRMQLEGRGLRLFFQGAGSGLEARGGALTDFLLAGADRAFHPARAVIEGRTVVVTSEAVLKPVAVRYGWTAAAQPNLFNREGLPAAPFRTDDWTEQ